MSTYTPPTPAELLQDRLDDNARLQRETERACEQQFGCMTKRAAAVLTELSVEREALTERLAEVNA